MEVPVDDDTVVPESPVSEAEEVNLGTDTSSEIADECVDIVPDSDDEGMHGTEVVDKTERRGGRCVGKRRYAPAKHSYAGYLRRLRHPLWRLETDKSCASTSHLKCSMGADSRVSCEHDRAINGSLNVDKNTQNWQCDGKKSNLGKISEDIGKETPTRDSLGEQNVFSRKREEVNLCRSDLPKLNYIESQEPGPSSEADALNFVDLYLSNGDPNAFHHVETGVLDRSMSSCILHSNGPQNLARIKNRTSIVKKLEVFDWSENLSDEEENYFVVNRSKLKFECEGNDPGRISKHHSVGSIDIKKQKALGNICELNTVEGRLNSNKMESRFQVEDEIDKGVCSSEKAMDTNFVNELDKEVIVNSPQKLLEDEQSKLDAVCTYDVGFDTQVAAEAMEALFYAVPLNLNPFFKHQSPQKTLQFSGDPSNSVSVDHCNLTSNSEGTGQQLMQSAKKLCGNIPGNFETPQEDERVLESELLSRATGLPFSGKLLTRKRTVRRRSLRNIIQHKSPTLQSSGDPSNSVSVDHCNWASNSEGTGQQLMQSAKNLCGNIPGNFETPQEDERVLETEPREMSMPLSGKLPTKKRTGRRSLRNTIQHKELYIEKTFSRQLGVDFNSFKVSNCGSDDKRSGEIRKISSGTHRNRKQSSSSSLKRFTDRSFKKIPEVMKINFPKKRRKKDEVVESGESKKASDSYMNRHQGAGVDKAGIVHKLKLEGWSHPRGKRTRAGVPCHSVGRNNQYASCAEDNVIKCPIGNNAMVEIAGPLQSGRKCQFSSKKKHLVNLSMQYSGGPGSLSVSNCKSAITSDKGISSGHDGDNSTKPQPFESDDLVSIVSDVKSTDRTLNVVPSRKPSRNCTDLFSFKGQGRGRGKSLSRSSLTKELARLGYAEMLPDFMPKDSRRGKGHANVRVLLSQNLDENIIKQQKKIVARLGFSIASCCSDASHFVADKFLRTKNMLEAIAIGIPVVTHLWLESCGQASSFIDEKMFILRDDRKEKEIGFSMPVSLALSRQHPLLRGHRVFITPNAKPSKDMIRSLVNAVQGQVVAETEDITTQGGIIVVSSEEDYTTCLPLLKKGTAVYSSELLLNGIVTQRLEYERHQLFKDWPISHPN